MIRVRATVTPVQRRQFADLTERQARRIARRELNEMGVEMVAEVERIVGEDYERRSGDRHKEDSMPLHESFEYRVFETGQGGFPMRVELTTKPGADTKKIAALIYGAKKRYVIRPNPPKRALAWGDAPGEITTFRREVVRFPENSAQPNPFIQRARNIVVRRRRRRRG